MHTRNTTYQIGIMEHGFLLHLYYGPRTEGSMDCLLSYYDRGFSGNPYEVRERREISMDYLPQEYSCFGNGDFRSPAFQMRDENGVFGVDLRCKSRKRYEGKYVIQGLPAVYAGVHGGGAAGGQSFRCGGDTQIRSPAGAGCDHKKRGSKE